MKSFSLGVKSLMLAGTVSVLSVTVAHAVEAADAAERLKSAMARQQLELSFSSVTSDGDDVILSDAKIKSTESDEAVDLGDLTLADVTEESNGDYRIGSLYLDTVVQKSDDVTVEIDGLTVEGLILPGDVKSDPFAGIVRYDRLEIDNIDVDIGDNNFLSMDDLSVKATIAADGALESTADVAKLAIDLDALDDEDNDEEFVDTLQEIDYDDISGSVEMAGRWHPVNGELSLSKFDIVLDDVGTLGLKLDILGYTADYVQLMSEMAARENNQNDPTASAMAALGMLQGISLSSLTLRFDDDSFTGRILNKLADDSGATPEQLIAGTQMTIQAQLSPYTGEAFATSAADAVKTFLDNPKSLEIAARPATPVQLFTLAMSAMGAPATVITQLGLTVTANK